MRAPIKKQQTELWTEPEPDTYEDEMKGRPPKKRSGVTIREFQEAQKIAFMANMELRQINPFRHQLRFYQSREGVRRKHVYVLIIDSLNQKAFWANKAKERLNMSDPDDTSCRPSNRLWSVLKVVEYVTTEYPAYCWRIGAEKRVITTEEGEFFLLKGELLHETEKALKIQFSNGTIDWVPKRWVEYRGGKIKMEEWFYYSRDGFSTPRKF